MQFSCEHCGTRYAVPDEKVRGKRVRTRCRKCGGEIIIQGPGVASLPPTAPAFSAPAARAEERWTVAVSRTEQRKMTTSEIVDAYAGGVISDQTLVWKQGMQTWQMPFEIPALALAIGARGVTRNAGWREPGRVSRPPPPPPPRNVDPLAEGWDDENEATRVSEGALPFLARKLMAEAKAPSRAPGPPPPPARPATSRPVPPPRPPGSRKPPPRPAARSERAPWSAVPSRDNEARRAVGGPSPVPAPTVDARRPPPSAPDPGAFNFDDEATEVIAPDRARALLDTEVEKSNDDHESERSETPIAFGFDDESTRVAQAPPPVEPAKPAPRAESAGRPLRAFPLIDASVPSSPPRRTATVEHAAPLPPPAAALEEPTDLLPRSRAEKVELTDPLPRVEIGNEEPTIVVEAPVKAAPEPPPAAPEPQKSVPQPMAPALEPRDIIRAFQNEPTRVVRAVKKKKKTGQIWLVVLLALVAAAAGGFIASEILARSHLPARPRAP